MCSYLAQGYYLQRHAADSNPRPFGHKSEALPLRHHRPHNKLDKERLSPHALLHNTEHKPGHVHTEDNGLYRRLINIILLNLYSNLLISRLIGKSVRLYKHNSQHWHVHVRNTFFQPFSQTSNLLHSWHKSAKAIANARLL